MEGPLKELAKLEKLTAKTSVKGRSTTVNDPLDSLLQSLYQAKDRIESEGVSEDVAAELAQAIEARKKEVDDRQKELYNSLARLGKALDKVSHGNSDGHRNFADAPIVQKFSTPLPTFSPLFSSDKSTAALKRTIALHFLRTGQFSTAETFLNVRQISPFLA
jgi:hypothetical protein